MSSLESRTILIFPDVEIGKVSSKIFLSTGEFVEIDTELGKKIKLFLRISRRIESKMTTTDGVDDEFFYLVESVSGINCHKTVLYLCNILSADLLADRSMDITGHDKVAELIENAEFDRLLEVVEGDGQSVDLVSKDPMAIVSNLEKSNKYPVTFHFLKKNDEGKYFPMHSVLILGVTNLGNLVGFHKDGPYSDNNFEIFNFSDFISLNKVKKGDLFCSVPIN